LLATTLIIGCDEQTPKEKSVQDVRYNGYFTLMEGTLSDGTAVSGVSWFNTRHPTGRFCLQADGLTCSGRYPAQGNFNSNLTGTFTCNTRIDGEYSAIREAGAEFVRPISATAQLSDGRDAEITFGPITRGSGVTTCFQ